MGVLRLLHQNSISLCNERVLRLLPSSCFLLRIPQTACTIRPYLVCIFAPTAMHMCLINFMATCMRFAC